MNRILALVCLLALPAIGAEPHPPTSEPPEVPTIVRTNQMWTHCEFKWWKVIGETTNLMAIKHTTDDMGFAFHYKGTNYPNSMGEYRVYEVYATDLMDQSTWSWLNGYIPYEGSTDGWLVSVEDMYVVTSVTTNLWEPEYELVTNQMVMAKSMPPMPPGLDLAAPVMVAETPAPPKKSNGGFRRAEVEAPKYIVTLPNPVKP